ncbi:hypothetical protein EYF80_003388 [Liparis tanakae]|uniref:Uncharacterized protein n=1 Tax=Liparis tanakae TaxID=230148 RepID=A0A4Z2J9E4_9TELE|nr:hypothetical protein EYF80_003388 [Liparis tanakae]
MSTWEEDDEVEKDEMGGGMEERRREERSVDGGQHAGEGCEGMNGWRQGRRKEGGRREVEREG